MVQRKMKRGSRTSKQKDNKLKFLSAISSAALSKNAQDIVVMDVRGIVTYTDHIMICTGNSDRQVCAIADAIEKEAKRFSERPLSIEGYERGHWVIIDFVDTVVHIFQPEPRKFYNLESIFMEAKRIDIVKGSVRKMC